MGRQGQGYLMTVVDTRTIVERIMVRCNECVRQVAVYVSGTQQIVAALENIGWSANDADEHYCGEHSE